MPKIGLVTVLFNSNDVLEDFFKSLSIQTFVNYHLYIIDNTPSAATDECLSTLANKFKIPGYTHFRSHENIGIAKGNNNGIQAALEDGCDFVLLLNNDIEFADVNMFKSMVDLADQRNEVLVVPKIYFYDTKKIWMAGARFEWWKAMAYHIGEREDDKEKYNVEGYYNFAPACFLLVKSSLFESVGMLDEKYFVYFEDTDFIYRAVKKGYRIFYCPSLSIFHRIGNSTGGYDSIFGIYYGNRNRIYFIRKHYGFFRKMFAYTFVIGTRLIKYLRYDGKQKKELVRAINDGFKMKL